jgi:HlyD family secretion protein
MKFSLRRVLRGGRAIFGPSTRVTDGSLRASPSTRVTVGSLRASRRIAMIAVAIVVVAAIALPWAHVAPAQERQIPTIRVQRGRVQVTVHATGDLRASRAMQLFVPPAAGSLTIIKLVPSGSALKAGDVIVQFDPSDQEFALEQAEFDLQLAEQERTKAEAETAVRAAEDEVALLKARFAVRRAELDAAANELVGALVAKQNVLLLDEARQRLAQLERDVKSHQATAVASAAVLREKRNKARASVETAKRNIESLEIRAPFDGFVTLRPNMMAFGGIYFGGSMPEYRIGDATNSGQLIADLIDTSRIEVTAKLPEQDRANVNPGQAVEISVDALPEAKLQGSVRTVSGVASRQLFEGGGTRRFDIAFEVQGDTSRIRPGVSAALAIAGPAFENALYIPRPAVFEVAGKPSVYVRTPDGFEPREVKVRAFTHAVAVIEGVDESAEVALVNPNETAGRTSRSASPAPATKRASL